jgi:hypothetical protein
MKERDSTDKREGEPKAEALGPVEAPAARRRRGGPALPPELAAAVLKAARLIKQRFKAHLDQRRVSEQAGQLFLRGLWPRRPGRPRHADVTEALRLESQQVTAKEIYRRLGKTDRLLQHALREAMRQRKTRARRRARKGAATNPPRLVTPTNAALLS